MFIKLITSTFLLFHSTLMSDRELRLFLRKCALQVLWNFSCFPRTIKKKSIWIINSCLARSFRVHGCMFLWLKNAKFSCNCFLTFSLKIKYIPWWEHFICLFPKHRTKIFTEHSHLIDHANTSVQTLFFWFSFCILSAGFPLPNIISVFSRTLSFNTLKNICSFCFYLRLWLFGDNKKFLNNFQLSIHLDFRYNLQVKTE